MCVLVTNSTFNMEYTVHAKQASLTNHTLSPFPGLVETSLPVHLSEAVVHHHYQDVVSCDPTLHEVCFWEEVDHCTDHHEARHGEEEVPVIKNQTKEYTISLEKSK